MCTFHITLFAIPHKSKPSGSRPIINVQGYGTGLCTKNIGILCERLVLPAMREQNIQKKRHSLAAPMVLCQK
jgi:hypothetical protein